MRTARLKPARPVVVWRTDHRCIVRQGDGSTEAVIRGGIRRGETGLLGPGGFATRENIGQARIDTRRGVRSAGPDQPGIAVQRHRSAEAIPGCGIIGTQLGLLSPRSASKLENKNSARISAGRRVIAERPDQCGVAIDGQAAAEAVARRSISCHEQLLLHPSGTAAREHRHPSGVHPAGRIGGAGSDEGGVTGQCHRGTEGIPGGTIVCSEFGFLRPLHFVAHEHIGAARIRAGRRVVGEGTDESGVAGERHRHAEEILHPRVIG